MKIPFRRGNDGLTDRQRARYAKRWRNGAGRAPSRDEMDEIRRLTPVTYKADDAGRVWLIHDGVPPLPLNITSASISDISAAEVRRTIEIDIEATEEDT